MFDLLVFLDDSLVLGLSGGNHGAITADFLIVVRHQSLQLLLNILLFLHKLLPVSEFILAALVDLPSHLLCSAVVLVFLHP